MILIGLLNVGIGFCTYSPQGDPPERIIPVLPPAHSSDGTVTGAQIPVEVMRSFIAKYPRNAPHARRLATPEGNVFEFELTRDAKTVRATFREDGAFVGEQ